MNAPVAAVAGTATTVVAGIVLGLLCLSAYGPIPTLVTFSLVFLFATIIRNAISHRR